MMKLIFALLLALYGNNINPTTDIANPFAAKEAAAPTGNEYIDAYLPVADSLESAFGIPAEVILSVAVIESGYGKSRNSKLLNNHFGIVGKNSLHKTHGIRSRYKQYSSVEDSYADFCGIISRKKFYPNMIGNEDPKAWVMAISKAGYSTHPTEWRRQVSNALHKFFK